MVRRRPSARRSLSSSAIVQARREGSAEEARIILSFLE
jgi:hypothetical protein